MMNDLISRSALLQDIEEAVVFTGRPSRNAEICGANKIIDRIKTASAVNAAEVVRCKDCKHFVEFSARSRACIDKPGECHIRAVRSIDRDFIDRMYNDFCSDGERKENGN